MRAALLSIALLLSLGCASEPAPSPVAVLGSAPDVATLAGTWHGSYWSAVTGRSGAIRFELRANGQEASGAVWMTPAPRSMSQGGSETASDGARGSRELQIRFVRVSAGEVKGTLEPYLDPDCGCRLSTSFAGKLDGDRIEGAYTTTGDVGHEVTDGKWEVKRSPAAKP